MSRISVNPKQDKINLYLDIIVKLQSTIDKEDS